MLARHAIAGSTVLAVAALITACSNATTASAPMAAPGHGSSAGSAYGLTNGSGSTSSTAITIGAPTAELQRSVRAAYTIPSGSFLASFDGVIARAVALGGYVASSMTEPAHNGRIVSGAVTLAIPAASLASFLNGTPSTFTAVSIDFASVDHTAQFVDVNARLASAHAHLHALDALLSKATSLGDITTLEQQIETVQVEIDTYQGQLNALTASVDMATATIALSERGAPRLVQTAPGPVNTGVSGGWHNAIQVTGTVLNVLITALPLLALAGLALALWHWAPRRLRRPTRAAP
ncbi:MAG: hypothetical protein QOE18_1239 [Chloroflexota bacterium]|nr:hypothetical protein [Chloroflexota bacterium]